MTIEKTKKKVVVIGGTGLIGSKVVAKMNAEGFKAIAAAPNTGVNTLTGDGLADVLSNASVVIDVSNSPSFEADAVMNFFKTSTENLLKFEAEAGVKHHVALSIVGTDRLPDSPYMRAKVAQEKLIKQGPIPYSIIHATQFFEFAKGIADGATKGDTVTLSSSLTQPIAADDVATAVAETAAADPLNGTLEIGGPERFSIADFVSKGLAAKGDRRTVIADATAPYFGAIPAEKALVPGPDARLFDTTFANWLDQQKAAVKTAG